MTINLCKLGKLPPRHDPRTFRLAKYLKAEIPAAPDACDWLALRKDPWPMFGNDLVGDCTCASAGHSIIDWMEAAGKPAEPTTEQILAAYSAITGYDPANPDSDQGAVELDVLKYWRKTGIAGHPIKAFVAVDLKNLDEVRQAIWLFGAVKLGIVLPNSGMDQDVWQVIPDDTGGIAGGHSICAAGYDAAFVKAVTWGAVKCMTWDFFAANVDECHAIISNDWFNEQNQQSGSGFDCAALQADLDALAAPEPLEAQQ